MSYSSVIRGNMLVAVMPVKNEADRWLNICLQNLLLVVDQVFIYDDGSTDATMDVALAHPGVSFVYKPDDAPSFMEHEGHFRQGMWSEFERSMEPTENDWILAVDADEMVAGELPELTGNAIEVAIPEVFGFDETGVPLIRTDGFWKGLHAPRLFRYRRNSVFRSKEMACGAQPSHVMSFSPPSEEFALLHFGYVKPEDRQIKYERYGSVGGHNSTHVDSILTRPTLERWEGPLPKVTR